MQKLTKEVAVGYRQEAADYAKTVVTWSAGGVLVACLLVLGVNVVEIVADEHALYHAPAPEVSVPSYAAGEGLSFTGNSYINDISYSGGAAQFRDLVIGDGKAQEVVRFTGATKQTEFFGDVIVHGKVIHK